MTTMTRRINVNLFCDPCSFVAFDCACACYIWSNEYDAYRNRRHFDVKCTKEIEKHTKKESSFGISLLQEAPHAIPQFN